MSTGESTARQRFGNPVVPPLGTVRRPGHSLGGASLVSLIARSAVIEFLVVACAAYLASAVYFEVTTKAWPPTDQYLPTALFIAGMVLIVSLALRDFAAIPAKSQLRFVSGGFAAVIITFLFLLISMFVFKVAQSYSRVTFFTQLTLVAIAVSASRTIMFSRIRAAITNVRVLASRLVIIGVHDRFLQIVKSLADDGVQIAATFDFPTRRAETGSADKDEIDLNATRQIVAACRTARADDVLVVPTDVNLSLACEIAATLSELPASVHVLPQTLLEHFRTARPGVLGTRTTVQLVPRPLSAFDYVLKRAFDIVVSALGLFLFSPMLAIVSAAVKLDSPGPALFRQTRHGYNNEAIQVIKFRTMTVTEDGHSFTQATKTDARITQIGRLLRRTNIDELPQLFNVLLGEMSIVGPRPHPVALNEQYERLLAPFMRRHNVKPGITGWAQINGYRGETDTTEKMKKRLEYDLYYIDNWSFMFDLQIVLLTLFSKKAFLNAY